MNCMDISRLATAGGPGSIDAMPRVLFSKQIDGVFLAHDPEKRVVRRSL